MTKENPLKNCKKFSNYDKDLHKYNVYIYPRMWSEAKISVFVGPARIDMHCNISYIVLMFST